MAARNIPQENTGEFGVKDEAEDIAVAIAASLDTPQGVPRTHIQGSTWWSPKTDEEWSTYFRQKSAEQVAEEFKDSPGYDKAIQESLEAVSEPPAEQVPSASTSSPKAKVASPANLPARLVDLDSMIQDMAVKQALEVPIVHEPDADIWIFIDPPPQQPEQDDASYARYVERCRSPKLMRSATLLALSSAFFEKALGPTAQHRVLRRRSLVGKLPSGIKYVLDLTPPSEGDEAVYLTTELCCSEGVRKWALAGKLWTISKTLIGGQEECSAFNRKQSEVSIQNNKELIEKSNASQGEKLRQLSHLEELPMPLPLQYTPLRHRSAIERVLLAITGQDPQLDSAVKVWTACAVARYFEVTHSHFNDYVVRWLRAPPNHHFLEVLPEVSVRIADGFQCHDLCRDTFALLVGEEALGSLYRTRPGFSGLTTVHGRKKEDLPEIYQTRVEYASKALIERVNGEFMAITSLEWLIHLPEMEKLASVVQPSLEETVYSLKLLLEKYIRGAISRALCAEYPEWSPLQPSAVVASNDLFPLQDNTRVWNDLVPRERVLTRSFWEYLRHQRLFEGPTNMHVTGANSDGLVPIATPNAAEAQLRQDGIIEEVSMADLEELDEKIQQFFRQHPLPGSSTVATSSSSQAIGPRLLAILHDKIYSRSSLHPECEIPSGEESDPLLDDAGARDPKQRKIRKLSFGYDSDVSDPPYDSYDEVFNLERVFQQAYKHIRSTAQRMLDTTDARLRSETLPCSMSDILVSLEDSEFKYLPLWAGGCDDGSGGVYDDQVPIAALGFSHPGPNVHQGSGSSVASSDFDFIRGVNSHNTSTVMNKGSEQNTSSVDDPFADAEFVRGLSTPGDSEYDFGSVASSGIGTTTEHIAQLDLGRDGHKSEKAKGKMPVSHGSLEAVTAELAAREQESTMRGKFEEAKGGAGAFAADDDFESIFDYDSDDDDGGDDFDEGNDSDDTIEAEKDSEGDLVMV
ncbi:MAG: hypothetical protein Q9191_002425 [Dirinaria sp. TL-2023a]